MTDEFDKLKQAMSKAPPAPRDATKRRAIGAALRAFDEEFSRHSQGSAAEQRRTTRQSRRSGSDLGRRFMTTLTTGVRGMLLGGASVAVLTLGMVAVLDRRDELPRLIAPPLGVERSDATAAQPTSARRPSEEPLMDQAGQSVGEPVFVEPESLEADAPEMPPSPTDRDAATKDAEGSQDISAASVPGQRAASRKEGRLRATLAPTKPSTGLRTRSTIQTLSSAPQGLIAPPSEPAPRPGYRDHGRDRFETVETNPVKVVAEDPVSTFSIDVDTASYAVMRRALMNGILPPDDAVRVEELINYFPYDYAPPEDISTPFATDVSIMATPWNSQTRLMRIAIQGYELSAAEKPRANLVFLIDSSGSMNAPEKLPLLINSFRLLLDQLDPDDTVAIVTYAGSAGTVLAPTRVAEASKILAALGRLRAGGSTAGAEGIRQAYQLAEQNFDEDGVNRVILATDGDFNVGITDPEQLKGFVERKRDTGIFLSVLGFGQGNLNDALMQTLAQNGNGQATYIDTLSEAQKTLVEEAGSTLFPIAKDVKIQVEFNPAAVAEYRLIGYETRALAREDFNNDNVDAGEIGSGHSVTALYEITPVGSAARMVDDLRYQAVAAPEANPSEYAFLKIRYKALDSTVSKLITTPVTRGMETDAPSTETRFAAAVAGFGQMLRGGEYTGDYSYDDVIALAQGAKGADPFGYRGEFVKLVRLARAAAALEPLPRQ